MFSYIFTDTDTETFIEEMIEMSKRRVVRRTSNNLTPEEQAIQAQKREERAKEAIKRAKASIKTPTAKTNQSSDPAETMQQATDKPIAATVTQTQPETIETVTQEEVPPKYVQETTRKQNFNQTTDTRPKLRKKERFEDKHKRVTTYLLKEHHQKLNETKVNYGIPITETINNALKEYFDKYNL